MVHSRYPQPSMEPPPFGDGNLGVLRRHVPEYRPSMEPPPFGDGNAENGTDRDPDVQPSMEPPPFGDGNGAASAMTCRMIRTLQWSHRPSAMETGLTGVCPGGDSPPSMEPPPFGDGNVAGRGFADHGLHPSMEPPPFGDGNVAGRGFADHGLHPSMEPPPFGDGNDHSRDERGTYQQAFNGATALRRWKPTPPDYSLGDAPDLQWSHRPSAMET